MKQNLFWASVYNLLAITVAADVLYPGIGVMLRLDVVRSAGAVNHVIDWFGHVDVGVARVGPQGLRETCSIAMVTAITPAARGSASARTPAARAAASSISAAIVSTVTAAPAPPVCRAKPKGYALSHTPDPTTTTRSITM